MAIRARYLTIDIQVDESTFTVTVETEGVVKERHTTRPLPRRIAFPMAIACLAASAANKNASVAFPEVFSFNLSNLEDFGATLLALNPEALADQGLALLLSTLVSAPT